MARATKPTAPEKPTLVETPTLVGSGETAIRISKKAAHDLIVSTNGRFFTALFITKEKEYRKINCLYLKDQGESILGYVKVREAIKLKKNKQEGTEENTIRNINLQTLKELKVFGKAYKVN
jgi:hypothetical protein